MTTEQPLPIVVDEDSLRCWACDYVGSIDSFDTCGACPNSVFCMKCNNEIDIKDGLPVLLCGKCECCKCFEHYGYSVEEENKTRKKQRNAALARKRRKTK